VRALTSSFNSLLLILAKKAVENLAERFILMTQLDEFVVDPARNADSHPCFAHRLILPLWFRTVPSDSVLHDQKVLSLVLY
jgi:hypothetical protein